MTLFEVLMAVENTKHANISTFDSTMHAQQLFYLQDQMSRT